jgi:hypothetical protein
LCSVHFRRIDAGVSQKSASSGLPSFAFVLSIPGFEDCFPLGMKDIKTGWTKPWREVREPSPSRLDVKVNYPYRIVYIRFIGTHRQYDAINVLEI